jgi:Zn-dependent M28 family amino/carboxypeptidase
MNLRCPAVSGLLLLTVVAAIPAAAQNPSGPDTTAIRALATELSADSMRGRGPWTSENAAAARRLTAELTRLGARPLQGTSLLVPFTTDARPRDTVFNVIAVFPARAGTITDQLVGITAHLDHLGVGPPDATGDSIYNGFLDDGIGMAMVLDVARRYAAHPGDRSVVVMFFNLEEQGLLGSVAWARAPGTRDLMRRFQLVLGVDAGAPAGEALNWELMGALPDHPAARLADSLARTRGWTTRATPARGISDVYIFSLVGVPVLFPIPGDRWRGYTPDQRAAAMTRFDHYHQPADQPDPAFPLVGTYRFADWLWQIVREASTAPRSPSQ